VRNIRAKSDPWFVEYLLRIGGGSKEANGDGEIRLPDDICIPQTSEDSDLDTLIDSIFPALNANMVNKPRSTRSTACTYYYTRERERELN
jgi:ATP-dependent DNA helicase PIF1